MSLSLVNMWLVDYDVEGWSPFFGSSLAWLSIAFSHLTDIELVCVHQRAPLSTILDLESNCVSFEATSGAMGMLWEKNTRLRHLHMSGNEFTRTSYSNMLVSAGRSCLETLDVEAT